MIANELSFQTKRDCFSVDILLLGGMYFYIFRENKELTQLQSYFEMKQNIRKNLGTMDDLLHPFYTVGYSSGVPTIS